MLGGLSAQYESNGDPGCIANNYGDPGGKSYGMYQFSSNAGTLEEYISWLCDNSWWFGTELRRYELCSEAFDNAWKWLADTNYDDFVRSQHDYIRDYFYKPAVRILADNGWHIENHYEILKDVVWSRAVQYGINNILEMWMDAVNVMGYPNLSYIDAPNFDEELIRKIYLVVCSSREWNNGPYRDSLNQRFTDECRDALSFIY